MLYAAVHAWIEFTFLMKTDGHVISLSAQQNRVDRFPEFAHAVIALWPRTIQPINRAVFPGDEPVGAGGDVHDDFTHQRLFKTSASSSLPRPTSRSHPKGFAGADSRSRRAGCCHSWQWARSSS